MTPELFSGYWETTYPASPPVGHLLRQKYPERWFRIHTLPESQRYAASVEESVEILRRHNALLTEVIGIKRQFVLVFTGYSETPQPVLSEPWLENHYPYSRAFASINPGNGPDLEQYWHFFMTTETWTPGSLDDLLRLIADDTIVNVLFVGVDQETIYAPYDGGADVFISSKSTRDALRQKYKSWLSAHPAGL